MTGYGCRIPVIIDKKWVFAGINKFWWCSTDEPWLILFLGCLDLLGLSQCLPVHTKEGQTSNARSATGWSSIHLVEQNFIGDTSNVPSHIHRNKQVTHQISYKVPLVSCLCPIQVWSFQLKNIQQTRINVQYFLKSNGNLVIIYQVKDIPVLAGPIHTKMKEIPHIKIFYCIQNLFFRLTVFGLEESWIKIDWQIVPLDTFFTVLIVNVHIHLAF